MAELNLKQEKFCQAYVMLRNATESAKSAGYSTVSAHTQGHRLVQREDIKERIEELEEEVQSRLDEEQAQSIANIESVINSNSAGENENSTN